MCIRDSVYKLDAVKSASMLDWNNIGELPMSLVDTSGMVLASSAYNVNRIYDLFDLKQN